MPKRYWYIIIAYIVAQLAISLYPLFMLAGLGKNDAIATTSIIVFTPATLLILYFLRKEMKQTEFRDSSSPGAIILWSISGVILALFAQGLAAYIETTFLGIQPGSENTMGLMEIARESPLFILLPVLFAPITEEVIFRKIIFGSIYKKTNFWVAVIVSALVFGAFHFDFTHMLVYFSMGVVFAFLYVKTRSIITPIVAHMAMNSFVVITQYFIDEEQIRQMREQLETIFIGGLL